MRAFRKAVFIALIACLGAAQGKAGEGMYPLSEIRKLDLAKLGVRIAAGDLYNPNGASLVDAIVNTGGCTGSFVSADGLILTNHHCAFPAVQAASSIENDYVTAGFLAKTRAGEIPAKGNSVRITDSYRDVSREILSAVSDTMDALGRTKAITRASKTLVAATEKNNPGKRAEVAEMIAGKSYVLFVYTSLRDVRLVYVPPRAIGDFGGEEDNWIWPRHTGDFSFLRAYVAPDGSPADYSPLNVPYHPKKFLKVQPAGVDDRDPVFILGYPGRTYRHRTADFMAFEEEVRMPFVAQLYEWQIATMEKAGRVERSVGLKFDARIKGLANTSKNYRGKLQGMKRIGIVEGKRRNEESLKKFIDDDPARALKYGGTLGQIASVYNEMRGTAPYDLQMDVLRSGSTPLNVSYSLYEASIERTKPDAERETAFMEKNFGRTKETLAQSLKNFHGPTDKLLYADMFSRARELPATQRSAALDAVLPRGADRTSLLRTIDSLYAGWTITSEQELAIAFQDSAAALLRRNDPFISLAARLYPEYQRLKELRQRREGELTRLYGLLGDVQMEFAGDDFLPDANSTLRFTAGRIAGYQPTDATYFYPITTLAGVVEKSSRGGHFIPPQRLTDLHKTRSFGRFAHPKLKDVPVDLLYDLDTTGGNSGSPLLNADGELVGVNFDRTFEATINDFAWSADYSRSIAVDIRYVLWVTQMIGGADHLLEEMGVGARE